MKKEEKPIYVICPRCDLNYINKKDKLCNVCKAEIGLIDASILIPDDDELLGEKLCPVCSVNYIGEDEEICFLCQRERDEKAEKMKGETWDYDEEEVVVADETEEVLEDIALVGEEEEVFEELEENPEYKEPNDFVFDVDEADFEDDDFDEDEDEDEDDDFDE